MTHISVTISHYFCTLIYCMLSMIVNLNCLSEASACIHTATVRFSISLEAAGTFFCSEMFLLKLFPITSFDRSYRVIITNCSSKVAIDRLFQ